MDFPKVGLGTRKLTWENCYNAVISALELGYTHIDTAQVYQNEEDVGKGLQAFLATGKKKREEIWLTTKVRMENYERLADSVQESLNKLKTDYVDLLLLHRPTNEAEHERCFDEMKKLKDTGKIKQFWVSNFTLAQLQHARNYTEGQIFTNQIEYHVWLSQNVIKSWADQQGMVVTAYSPLWHGHLLKDDSSKIPADKGKLGKIAEKHGITIAQVCLAWLLQHWCVVIPRSKNRERLKENLAAQQVTLDHEDLEVIATLPKNHRYINPPFAPQWDK